MHEYRRFIQQQVDTRGWKQADLVRSSGLRRQLVSSILSDSREHLGQMPDDSTLEGLAKAFGVPVEVVRIAAARSLVGYIDDGSDLTIQLQDVSTDALLNEVRRRINERQAATTDQAAPTRASREATEVEKIELTHEAQGRTLGARMKFGKPASPDAVEDGQ